MSFLINSLGPWLQVAAEAVTLFTLVVLLPVSAFKRTRVAAAALILYASWALGILLGVWAAVLTFIIWGALALGGYWNRPRRAPRNRTSNRSDVSVDELAAWITAELRKHEGCEDCLVTGVYRLAAIDDEGCN